MRTFDDQILLLPRQDYWAWLQAARPYVLAFGPNVTPDPGVAARYMAPRQVVTFPRLAGAFPEIGDPLAWLRKNAEGVRLDPVDATSPALLAKDLQRRVRQNDRYGARRRSFHLLWPTDYPYVTQPFGVNPQIYRRYGMPGHEGIDIRAPTNSNVYACADGEVYQVYTDAIHHAYGIHVRIQHDDSYKTIYAHLARPLVREGDPVVAGQVIGRADSTGNSSAAHLHLSLKRDGATARGETTYPKDIIDPTPFLVWPSANTAQAAKGLTARARHGVNLARPGGATRADIDLATRLGAAVLLIVSAEPAETIEALRAAGPGARFIARLAEAPGEEAVRPARSVARAVADGGRLFRLSVRAFEVAA